MTSNIEKEPTSQNGTENEKSESETRDIYFIILYQRKQQEKPDEFAFSENDCIPKNIYTDEINQEGTYFYKKVFKFIGKADNQYSLEFEIIKDYYIIKFEINDNSFVYDVELEKGNKILTNIPKENIDQKIIDYHKKIDIFLEALKNNNEENKNETLYKDTINLFEKKKDFSLLISLFVQIYKNKELCPILIAKFKEMNNNTNDNEKNMERSKDLEKYIDIFKDISSEADNLINNNDYDAIQFYGIILCYLNYYDINTFNKIFEKLFTKQWDVSYEILLIYFSYFLNPINQNLDFYRKFIYY